MTLDEFDAFVLLPENRNRLYEFIGGEAVEIVSNNYSSMIALSIAGRLVIFVDTHHLGYVTGANGGYKVSGERYIPKAAFVSRLKQSSPSTEPYNSIPPDIVVEFAFPSSIDNIRVKIANYLSAGTMVWLIEGEKKQVELYSPGKPIAIVGINGVLDGGDVLPGFTLAVRDIFAA